eukprot:gnl/Hemi2/11045_TR3792_c0_g1_i1.p1 gnl/Hemi2/11045_TR3792_c0_g1~~gnl/Hemi2/11045_TR3792_c0_g1_i1.p1  ORF type:complete len:208 (-),score=36.56 gnl/Hemi2/11045_TR3792_c0_g1_i1:64-687(-)
MSPKDDTFLSSSLDNTVRLWDLRTNVCQGLLRTLVPSAVSYDPQGLIFAATTQHCNVKLFDLRSFDQGPFDTFVVDTTGAKQLKWTGMKFSPDNKYILLYGPTDVILLIDAFNGEKVVQYTGHANPSGLDLEASFSPDGQYVMSGSEDGTVHVWQTVTAEKVAVWTGHAGPTRCVQWNPTRMMVASACTNVVFWRPNMDFTPSQPPL